MDLVINEDDLTNSDIQGVSSKVRAILTDENNNILIANYGGVILLPGGSIDSGEQVETALIRELLEEIGTKYYPDELEYLATLNYFQKNYLQRNGNLENRLVATTYFSGKYKDINLSRCNLTEKEKKDNFTLQLVPINELIAMLLNNKTENPRNKYFQKELLTILKYYEEANLLSLF